VFKAQAPPGAKQATNEEIDRFISEVKDAEAWGPGGNDKAQVAVMRRWGSELAGFLFQQYDPENQGKTVWEQFRKANPRETSNLKLNQLLNRYSDWAGKPDPMPDPPKTAP
jgi:hypothetical protein